ncbi:MAG TPA: acylneuraminate cytidylyltransferase family protein [Gammaproteobacteria bacterium]|nr:acylneuraminate cytidylyltransferase family protein [Gammaproteobacteria bacterium]
MSEIIALIPARGGSKAIPRKNIKSLDGKPLIAWTIEAALQSGQFSQVIVSTDNQEIAQVSREWGAQVPFIRPTELAQDDSTQISVVTHAIRWLESHEHIQPNYVMLLQPTSPLRTAEDIVAAIKIAKTRDAIAVVSVCPAVHHPYLTKRVSENGTLDDFMPDHLTDLRRQVLPPVYTLNGAIYLNRRESLLHDRMFLPQGTCAYIMPPERSLDIDSPWDFYLADLILRDNYEHRIP